MQFWVVLAAVTHRNDCMVHLIAALGLPDNATASVKLPVQVQSIQANGDWSKNQGLLESLLTANSVVALDFDQLAVVFELFD